MQINKNNLKQLLQSKKNIESLFDEFTIQYNDIFIKKDLIEYDQVFSLDLAIYSEYSKFINILAELEFNIELIENKHIQSIIINLMSGEQLPPDEMRKSIKFDHLYYSYVLCELYIIIPYILEAYFQEEYKTKHPNWHIDKIKYKVRTFKLPKYINKTIKCFESWDRLEDKINKFSLELNEKHPESKSTYLENHQKFSRLMNNFILVQLDIKIGRKMMFLSKLSVSWYWLLLVLVFIAAIVTLIIFYIQK